MSRHTHDYDLVIVGMGSGGATAAEFALALGLRVAAVERDRLGGDCLWTGCVPSKSLIAAARAAHTMRTADRFGIPGVEPDIDLPAVWKRIDSVRREVEAADDNARRWENLGVDLHIGDARLAGPHTVSVGGRRLRTRFILLATGSRPWLPPIPGLSDTQVLTTDNLFDLEDPPTSLICLGGGPIAVETMQAMQRLGVVAQIVEVAPRPLAREEPTLVKPLLESLRAEGMTIDAGVDVEKVERSSGRTVLHGRMVGEAVRYEADALLVAAGRRPVTDGLGLAEIGVETDTGIRVDDHLRTTVDSVYAVGDAAGRHQFTHSAGYEGAVAVRNMFLPLHRRARAVVPWCTFTDPELAHVGLTESEARETHGRSVNVFETDLRAADRARTDDTNGRVRIVCARRRIVGAHVLAPSAGELTGELALAIERGVSIDDLAGVVHAYPTYSSALQLTAAAALRGRMRKLGWLARRGR